MREALSSEGQTHLSAVLSAAAYPQATVTQSAWLSSQGAGISRVRLHTGGQSGRCSVPGPPRTRGSARARPFLLSVPSPLSFLCQPLGSCRSSQVDLPSLPLQSARLFPGADRVAPSSAGSVLFCRLINRWSLLIFQPPERILAAVPSFREQRALCLSSPGRDQPIPKSPSVPLLFPLGLVQPADCASFFHSWALPLPVLDSLSLRWPLSCSVLELPGERALGLRLPGIVPLKQTVLLPVCLYLITFSSGLCQAACTPKSLAALAGGVPVLTVVRRFSS